MKLKNNYQICNRCVMDTSDPGILFDEKGNCNHCSNFLSVRLNKIRYKKETNALENFFEKICFKFFSIFFLAFLFIFSRAH